MMRLAERAGWYSLPRPLQVLLSRLRTGEVLTDAERAEMCDAADALLESDKMLRRSLSDAQDEVRKLQKAGGRKRWGW